jgi:hypothetical protein
MKRIIPKYFRSLREDRYFPENLSEIEQLRWDRVQDRINLIETKWRKIFREAPKDGHFHGYHKFWRKNHYENNHVLFNIGEHGISNTFLEERDDYYAKDFVLCLPDNKVPMYINSTFAKIREAVKKRLAGEKEYQPYTMVQDLVDLYYQHERESKRLNLSVGFCNKIILEHFRTLSKKCDYPPHYEPLITFTINNRIYMARSGQFILTPEMDNHFFWKNDLMNNEKYDLSRSKTYQLTVRDGCF